MIEKSTYMYCVYFLLNLRSQY